MAEDIKHIIESLLFVSETPLTMDHLKGIIEGEETAAIRSAIDELMAEYEQRDGGFVLKQVAGGYQFRTQGRYNEWIKRLVKPSTPRLSKAALETLAIIAYNQPIIRSDIEHIRGVDSGGVIRMLMERKLIRVLGRKEIPGRPLIYATTKHFLEVFELKDLKDLPTPKEIEELSRSRLEEQPEDDDHGEDMPTASPASADAPEAEDESPAAKDDPSPLDPTSE
ncbi:MAG: SMC-Scp complex subunit ScpB [Deltaproteobacteria bacterium]|nr:SMC-Scp complex subunit ScpB [Deltaproteobacteria bacterium]